MKILAGFVVLFLCTEMVICQPPWKVVHITETHTEVRVTQCSDPEIYLQFGNAITGMTISDCENIASKRKICANTTVGVSRFPLWPCDVSRIDSLTLTPFKGKPRHEHIIKNGICFPPNLCAEHGHLKAKEYAVLALVKVVEPRECVSGVIKYVTDIYLQGDVCDTRTHILKAANGTNYAIEFKQG